MPQYSAEEIAWVASLYWDIPAVMSDDVVVATAIALAESGGDTQAHNPDASTRDDSYGLWQVNMYGGLGPDRRREFNLTADTDLFDPQTNARVAWGIFHNVGNDFSPWTTYTSGDYKTHMAAARAGWDNKRKPAEGAGGGEEQTEDTGIIALANAAIAIARAVGGAAIWLANPENWGRVALVGTGGALLIGALVITAKPGTKITAAVTAAPRTVGTVAAKTRKATTT